MALRAILWPLGIILLFLGVLTVPFLAVRHPGLRARLLDQGIHHLVGPGWVLRIDEVERFDPGRIRMRGIHLVRLGQWPHEEEWASVSLLDLGLHPAALLRRHLSASHLRIDTLRVHTDVAPPSFRASSARPGNQATEQGLRLPWLRVDFLSVGAAEIWKGDTLSLSGSLDMTGLGQHGGHVEAQLGQISLTLPADSLTAVLRGGKIAGDLSSLLSLRKARLLAQGLDSGVDAEIRLPPRPGGPLRGSMSWDLDRLQPAQLLFTRRLNVPFSAEDSLRGSARIDVDSSSARVLLGLTGRLLAGPLDTLRILANLRGRSLRVDELWVEHRCGSLTADGEVDLVDSLTVRAHLNLSGVDLADPSLDPWLHDAPRPRIDGRVEGYAGLGPHGPDVEGSGELDAVRLLGHTMGPVRFAGRFAGGLLSVDSLELGRIGSRLRAAGVWSMRDGAITAQSSLEGVSLESWVAPWIKGVPLEGIVDGAVSVTGNTRSPMVSGKVQARDFRVVEVRAGQVWGDSIAGTLAPFSLGGRLRAERIDAYDVKMDSASFRADWKKRLTVEAEAEQESLRATARVEIVPAEPGSLLVESLQLVPGSLAPWENMQPARILWAKGSARIEDVWMESTDGRIAGDLAVGPAGSTLSASLRLADIDLDALRKLLALPDSSLTGFVDADAEIAGSALRPSVDARLHGRKIVLAGWPAGEVAARVASDEEGRCRIDSLSAGAGRGRGRLVAPEISIRLPRPLPAFLRAMQDSLPILLAETQLAGRISIDTLSLNRIVRTALPVTPGAGMGILAEPIDPMALKIRTLRPGEESQAQSIAEQVEGSVQLDLALGGTAAAPRAAVQGKLANLRLYRARADSVLFALSYEPDRAVLDSLVWHRGTEASHAQGEFPLVLSLVPRETRILVDRPLAFDAKLPAIDLAILGIVTRAIPEPSGSLSGAIALRGTPQKMTPEGSLAVSDGGFRLPNREERIEEIQGRLSLDSTGVRIESLQGSLGREGRVEVSGWFRDLDHFELEGKVRKATVFETGLYHFTADGDFDASPHLDDHQPLYPEVRGTVEVLEGAIIGDLAKVPLPPAGAATKRSPWHAEVDVHAPGNVRISTPIASVDLGQGDLHVSFVDPMINVSGGIQVLGGRYRVFNNIFTITGGTVEFHDLGRGPEPILDVTAETAVTDLPVAGEAAQEITVTIRATGPILALKLEFTSSPERTQDEIVSLLSIGRLTNPAKGTIGVSDPSRRYLLTEAVSQIESQISSLVAPLQNVSLEPGLGPGQAWKLNVRQMLLPQVSLAYSREIAQMPGQEMSLRYNLRGLLYLNAGVERRPVQGGSPVDRVSLDLKLRFEY